MLHNALVPANTESLWLDSRVGKIGRAVICTLAATLLAGCSGDRKSPSMTAPEIADAPDTTNYGGPRVLGLIGGCAPRTIYAQNKWPPSGAALRAAPDIGSAKLGGFLGNDPIKVDGFVETPKAVYKNNPEDRDGRIWYHVPKGTTARNGDGTFTLQVNEGGWVNSAAVRAVRYDDTNFGPFDPTGLTPDSGPAVSLPPECKGQTSG